MDLSDRALTQAAAATHGASYRERSCRRLTAYVLKQVADDLNATGTVYSDVADAYCTEAKRLETTKDNRDG